MVNTQIPEFLLNTTTRNNFNMSTPAFVADADFSQTPRYFKKPSWRPPTRRHKPAKAVLADEQRRMTALIAEYDQQQQENNAAANTKNPASAVSYAYLDAAPSLKPHKWWCDITGLEGKYKSVRHGLRYHNVEIFSIVQNLPPGVDQQYLELRHAGVVLR